MKTKKEMISDWASASEQDPKGAATRREIEAMLEITAGKAYELAVRHVVKQIERPPVYLLDPSEQTMEDYGYRHYFGRDDEE